MISIVIPLYNKEEYISKCITSVFKQTYEDYEIVVIDDGSTDKSVNLVDKIQSDKLRLIRKSNGGPSSARNMGVRESKGEWVVFLDADDFLLPYALEYFTLLIKNNLNIDYITCNYFQQIDNQLSLFSYKTFEGIVPNNFYFEACGYLTDRAGSAIYSREILLLYPFDEKLRRYEDAECQYRILNRYRVYQSWIPVMISNRDASSAAGIRDFIHEDFLGYLVFSEKNFWERIMLYKLALQAKEEYPCDSELLYKHIYHRVDYRIIYLVLKSRSVFLRFYYRYFNPLTRKKYRLEQLLNSYKVEDVI